MLRETAAPYVVKACLKTAVAVPSPRPVGNTLQTDVLYLKASPLPPAPKIQRIHHRKFETDVWDDFFDLYSMLRERFNFIELEIPVSFKMELSHFI